MSRGSAPRAGRRAAPDRAAFVRRYRAIWTCCWWSRRWRGPRPRRSTLSWPRTPSAPRSSRVATSSRRCSRRRCVPPHGRGVARACHRTGVASHGLPVGRAAGPGGSRPARQPLSQPASHSVTQGRGVSGWYGVKDAACPLSTGGGGGGTATQPASHSASTQPKSLQLLSHGALPGRRRGRRGGGDAAARGAGGGVQVGQPPSLLLRTKMLRTKPRP